MTVVANLEDELVLHRDFERFDALREGRERGCSRFLGAAARPRPGATRVASKGQAGEKRPRGGRHFLAHPLDSRLWAR